MADCLICRKAIASGKKIYEGKVNNPRKIVILKNESDYVNNDMLEKEGLKNMLPQAKSIEEGVKIYRKFPTFAEKENKFGAYAIEVKFIDLEKLKQKAIVVTSKEKRPRKQNDDYGQDR